MRSINEINRKRFEKLISHLDGESAVKIDNTNSVFMPLNIDFLGDVETPAGPAKQYSFAHYYEQNMDLVPDPDMEILHIPGKDWLFPMAFQDSYRYQRAIWWEDGRMKMNSRVLSDLVMFCHVWFKNICEQQNIK